MDKKIDLVCTRTDPNDSEKTQILLIKSENKLEIPGHIRVKNGNDQESILNFLNQNFGSEKLKDFGT